MSSIILAEYGRPPLLTRVCAMSTTHSSTSFKNRSGLGGNKSSSVAVSGFMLSRLHAVVRYRCISDSSEGSSEGSNERSRTVCCDLDKINLTNPWASCSYHNHAHSISRARCLCPHPRMSCFGSLNVGSNKLMFGHSCGGTCASLNGLHLVAVTLCRPLRSTAILYVAAG